MQESAQQRRWPFTPFVTFVLSAALAVVALSIIFRAADGSPEGRAARAQPAQEQVSDVAATNIEPGAGGPKSLPATSEPEPSLLEILQAAEQLVAAGVIDPPAPEPSLLEILLAADALAKAGSDLVATPAPEREPAPSMREILLAADALITAGFMERPGPTLGDVLIAIDLIEKSKVPAPAPPQPAPQTRAAAPPPPPNSAPNPAPPPVSADANGWHDAGFDRSVLAAVNQRRAGAGLTPLSREARLASAAAAYAEVLTAFSWFSHTGPDGSTLVSRIEAAGFPFTVQIGEVIAWGTLGWDADAIAQAWMDSPSHRQQIMEPTYRLAGISCFFNDTQVRCVMDLAQ